jgi:hypothetical protein
MMFIAALSSAWPVWAERQQLLARNQQILPILEDLITNIIDKARNRNILKSSDTSTIYRNKSRGVAGKKDKKGSNNSKDQKKDKYKSCSYPNPRHKEEDCLQTNKEKRKE